MKITAVTMVKNEADIIEHTLDAMIAQGVDEVIVADNMSNDGTREILEDMEHDIPLVIREDREPGYYQSEKMTNLANLAFAQGAEWVIPFDADELFCPDSALDMRAVIASQMDPHNDLSVCHVKLFNYFPTSKDDISISNPVERIQYREAEPQLLTKVIVRNGFDIKLWQGNHGADTKGRTAVIPAFIRHYPWRSFEQFLSKVTNGYKALQATNLPEDSGSHWRGYGELLERGGVEALRDHYEKWFVDPDVKLVHDPAYAK